MEHTGEENYRRFLDGDRRAFEAILKEYRTGLILFVNRYVKDLYAAEDIAIDVFADLIVRPGRYNFKTSLKTYLFMIGRSRALDWLRHKKKITITDLAEATHLQTDASADNPEAQLLTDERKRALNAAVGDLPEPMRAAVHLVYFEELSYEDAARILHKSRKQVDNLLYRAKKILRGALTKDGDERL